MDIVYLLEKERYSEILNLLQTKNYNLNYIFEYYGSYTPLIYTISMKLYHGEKSMHYLNRIAIEMVNKGASVNYRNGDGVTPLMMACFVGNYPMVKFLIEAKSSINVTSKKRDTALLCACRGHRNQKIIELLLENSANPNVQDSDGETPLFNLCYYNFSKLDLLLNKGADTNIQSKNGITALMYACSLDHHEQVKSLLCNKTNTKLKDRHGNMAIDFSIFRETTDLFDLNTGCDTSLKKKFKYTKRNLLFCLHSMKSEKWLCMF